MNIPDMPVEVPVDHPNEDTEWNDILRKHGVIPEKPPDRSKELEEALVQAQQIIHDNRLEGKDLDELDELEDEEDADFLDSYRQKRMDELAALRTSSVYNQVYPVQKPEYAKEVTEESSKAYVFVLLTSSAGANTESKLMVEIWRELATRFGDIKFCQMQANLCIEGYPDRNTPTILVYKDGDIKRQIVTLRELRGDKTTFRDMEKLLVGVGAVKVLDTRLTKDVDEEPRKTNGIRDSSRKVGDDSDSDWD
ncbi:phosducin family protein [Myriangium duriaei CBS 260.36]|uniref:Phosducin family protein n=1 Tax=Myriangium duriaei CBS 260.36 TaxID=1168546 RepID=A0A9P4IXL7_9PEZI|nr:phosducin family protein [Myriangium duriaei CBS 260.36]